MASTACVARVPIVPFAAHVSGVAAAARVPFSDVASVVPARG